MILEGRLISEYRNSMPTVRNHTHCQVAKKSQRTDQNLPKSMTTQKHRQTAEDKALKHNTQYT